MTTNAAVPYINDPDLTSLMTNDVAAPENDVITTKNDATALENDVAATKNEVAALENDVTPIENDVTVPENDVTASENEIPAPSAHASPACPQKKRLQEDEERPPPRKRKLNRGTELEQVGQSNGTEDHGLGRVKEIIEANSVTTSPTGARADLRKPFCNIFLRGWRLSAQFPKVCSSQGKATIFEVLRRIVGLLWEERLLQVPGLRGDINVVEMVVEEVKRDNTRLFSRTPPTLTVLLTERLFDRYYRAARLSSKPVNLGSATQQWDKLKTELGVGTNSELASLLIHCYKAWESVACGRCRRHMQVGLEGVTGRALQNSICIVSCSCGRDTSGGFMIACDNCTKWQHGVCVEVTQDTVPLQYYCPRCTAEKRRSKEAAARATQQVAGVPVVESDGDSVASCGNNNELYSTDDSEPEVINLDSD